MTCEKPWLSASACLLHSHYLRLPGAAHFRRCRPSTSCHTYWIGAERCCSCRFRGRVRELCVLFKQGDCTKAHLANKNTVSDAGGGALTKRVTAAMTTKRRGQYWLHTHTHAASFHICVAWGRCDQFGLALTLWACGFAVNIIVKHCWSCTISTVFNHQTNRYNPALLFFASPADAHHYYCLLFMLIIQINICLMESGVALSHKRIHTHHP